MKKGFVLVLVVAGISGCATVEEPVPVRRAEVAPQRVVAPVTAPGAAVWPASAPAIHAQSAILIDARSGATLYEKNADAARQVASTQKLLTALVVMKDGDLSDRLVVMPEDTRVEPSKLGLRPGQTYSRQDLLSALIVKSENDAAAALARDVAGSETAFAQRMNNEAREIGATNSWFVNAHGLPAPQHSTARDMARIAYRAYREPLLRRLMATKHHTFVFASGRTRTLENTNKLLGKSPGVNGMKTGYTFAAGRCLISSSALGGREVILVQLGSRTEYIFSDAERLMQWAALRG